MITTSVNQVSTANNKFQAAKRLGNMTGQLKYRNTLSFGKTQIANSEGDPELSITRNRRVHCTYLKR